MIQIGLQDIDLSDFEPLTHYIPEAYFRSLLATRALYASRVDAQKGDVNDGKLPAQNLAEPSPGDVSILHEISPTTSAKFIISQSIALNRGRRMNYLHSWTMRADEHPDMWRQYGDSGHGVCIKTTAGRLKAALGIGQFPGQATNDDGFKLSIELKKVHYCGDGAAVPVMPSYFATTSKRPQFEGEAEARVEAHIRGDRALLWYEKHDPPRSQLLPVNLERLFEAVFLGPCMAESVARELTAVTNKAAGTNVTRPSTIRLR